MQRPSAPLHGDVEAVLLPLILYEAAVTLVVNVLEDLAEDCPQVFLRNVLVRTAPQVWYLDISPVSKVESGPVAVG